MIHLLVDSSADFSTQELKEQNLTMVPLTITVNETQNYRDELDLSRSELYRLLMEGTNTVKTSQPSPQDFVEKFEAIRDAGDQAICLLLSSGLSGTYQSAVLAKDIVDYDGIYLIDTLTATVGIRILVGYAQCLLQQGKTAADIAASLESVKQKVQIRVVVDTLKYLYLGGRVSKTTALVANAVTIKPGIYVTPEGTVAIGSKYLGINRAVKDLVKMAKAAQMAPGAPLYILYSQNTVNAEVLEKALAAAGIPADGMYEIGATIGVHTGPGVFGVVYMEA